MRETFSFLSAGQIVFGNGAVAQVGELINDIHGRRIFIVTDAVLEKAGIVDKVCKPLTNMKFEIEVFAGGEPEPTLGMVLSCIQRGRQFHPDTILGLGGGSNMDTAKLAAAVLRHGGSPVDYVGEAKIPGPVVPIVCIPTTAGTGSEVSAAAVFTDTDKQLKVSCLSNHLRPRLAIVDPLLTLSCPAKVTADSGIDALTHAIEGFTAVDNHLYPLPIGERSVYQGKNPLADLCAEKAISLVCRFLARAVHHPADLEAREGMALAATLGGLAFSNAGVALVHAMEYPVGAAVHVSHGAGNGLLLPYVMRYNLPVREPEFARIAELMGLPVEGLPGAEAAQAAIHYVEKLRKEIGIPTQLRELGVRQDQLHSFAEKAHNVKRLMRVNPRYPRIEEIESIYNEAW